MKGSRTNMGKLIETFSVHSTSFDLALNKAREEAETKLSLIIDDETGESKLQRAKLYLKHACIDISAWNRYDGTDWEFVFEMRED